MRAPVGLAPVGLVVLVLLATMGLIGAPAATATPGPCSRPPLEVRILPGPVGSSGPTTLAVTDAVARRVPIVPRPAGTSTDPEALDRLRAKAATTDLALYTMYLADFRVPRTELSGVGFGEVMAPQGKTVAAVTIVPTSKRGFRAGDVADVSPFAYEATTTFAPLSLTVSSSGKRATYAYDGVEGDVEIRRLTDSSICLDIDVSFTRDGQTVASAVGTVRAPVVRAAPAFFYT